MWCCLRIQTLLIFVLVNSDTRISQHVKNSIWCSSLWFQSTAFILPDPGNVAAFQNIFQHVGTIFELASLTEEVQYSMLSSDMLLCCVRSFAIFFVSDAIQMWTVCCIMLSVACCINSIVKWIYCWYFCLFGLISLGATQPVYCKWFLL